MGNSTATVPAGTPVDDGLAPLDTILATMRWAREAAEAACAQLTTLAGTDAVDAGRAALKVRALVLKAAKAATPYVHARLKAAAPKPPGERTHEEWLADMERAAAEVAAAESGPEPPAPSAGSSQRARACLSLVPHPPMRAPQVGQRWSERTRALPAHRPAGGLGATGTKAG